MAINRIFHINVVCRDLDRSIEFYRDTLGMKVIDGPYDSSGPTLSGIGQGAQMWGVNPDEVECRFAFLRFGDDESETVLDLLEFVKPRSYGVAHSNLQMIGIARIAFKVDDVETEYQRLSGLGVKFLTPPCVNQQQYGDGDLVSYSYCCFYDPDGTILEIFGTETSPSSN